MPVLSALWEGEAGGLQTWAQSGQLSDLVKPCFIIKKPKSPGDVAQDESLGFNSYIKKKSHFTFTSNLYRVTLRHIPTMAPYCPYMKYKMPYFAKTLPHRASACLQPYPMLLFPSLAPLQSPWFPFSWRHMKCFLTWKLCKLFCVSRFFPSSPHWILVTLKIWSGFYLCNSNKVVHLFLLSCCCVHFSCFVIAYAIVYSQIPPNPKHLEDLSTSITLCTYQYLYECLLIEWCACFKI